MCIRDRYHPKWDGLVPDGLLIDTKPPTIIEVFGMSESNVEYHLHRDYKIKHFTSLKPSYDFWYWDAFKKDLTTSLKHIEKHNNS